MSQLGSVDVKESYLNFKRGDIAKFVTIFAEEYNKPELHDRVLVFDIVEDENIGENVLTKTDSIESTEEFIITSKTKAADSTIVAHEDKGASSFPSEMNVEFQRKRVVESNLPYSRKRQKHELSETIRSEHETEPKQEAEPDEHEEGISKIKISNRLEKDVRVDNETTTEQDTIISSDSDKLVSLSPKDGVTNPTNQDVRVDNETTTEQDTIVSSDSDKLVSLSPEDGATNSTNQVLRQHKIFVHACWLAVHSTYFRSLFFSGMKESLSKEVHLTVPESEEKGHLLLLEAIYNPRALHNVSVDQLLVVLELVDKYNVKLVFNKCKYVLQELTLSLEVCEKIMFVVQVKHNMTNIKDLIYSIEIFLAKVFSPLDQKWQTKNFENLSEPLLKCLLSSNQLITQSENTVFHALMHWIEYTNYDPSVATMCKTSLGRLSCTSLLSLVRFGLLTLDYLYNVVQHHPVATKMAGFNQFYLDGVTYHALPETIKQRMSVSEKTEKRCECTDVIVQYTWVLECAKIRNLANEAKLLSELFWWCGYRMQMSVKIENSSAFRFILLACDLTCKSEISLVWTWKATLDEMDSGFYLGSTQTHTFSSDKPVARSSQFLQMHRLGSAKLISIDISLATGR